MTQAPPLVHRGRARQTLESELFACSYLRVAGLALGGLLGPPPDVPWSPPRDCG